MSSNITHKVSYNVALHSTAVSKCILAFAAQEKNRNIETLELNRFTNNSITDLKKLKAELDQIKENGFSIDQGEFNENINCVGVTLFQNQQLVGALRLSDSKERITGKNIHEIAEILKQKAIFVSRQL